MRVRLLAFASASDAIGAAEMDLDLPEGARVSDLRAWLDPRYPALASLWPRLAIAVDGAIAKADGLLTEGAEVALLPPVSGGADEAPPEARVAKLKVELVDTAIDPQDVISRIASPGCGAILLFLGTVRDHAPRQGSVSDSPPRSVVKLTYSAYRLMAQKALHRIAVDLESTVKGLRVSIVHRLGEIPVGDSSVAIGIAAPHRAAAYEASRLALERLKAEVPIWKLEHFATGEATWREEESLLQSWKPP
jgi:molybdopterin synthase catalytic subunit